MGTVRVSAFAGRPLLDLTSHARHGPGRRDRLRAEEIAIIARTVRRAPEVMVKVLTRGSPDLGGVAKHFGYLGRYGELALETDEGEQLSGRTIGKALLDRWDLDLDEHGRGAGVSENRGRQAPRLVHKLLFSMPAGTPPDAVLTATRNFLREEFGLKHRYAFVLHTDEPHPHVHAVVKAVSEQGVRLHVRKATLRLWRHEFARHLRAQGIEANATERSVRGQSRAPKRDPIYRAAKRGCSSYIAERAQQIQRELGAGRVRIEGSSKLQKTRSAVLRGWSAIGDALRAEGRHQLAEEVARFAGGMEPARSDQEWLIRDIIEVTRQSRQKEITITR
jgi:hypothetical protein